MEVNTFISKLKADDSKNDLFDMDQVFGEYQTVSSRLPKNQRGTFALNVLCVLCRNLDKVQWWRDGVDDKSLTTMSIECVRVARDLQENDRVKTLACIYHIHKHVVKKNSLMPPELVLKLSYMPFECDDKSLLVTYYKTYWGIITDRITYISQLKSKRLNIAKLLPKLTEDVIRVIRIYDTVQFCSDLLVFLVKKVNALFNESTKELNKFFGKIFKAVSEKSECFKTLKERIALDIYVSFNECFVVVIESGLKTNFKEFFLEDIVRQCMDMLGHHSDIFHCLQTFYSNTICSVFNQKALNNSNCIEIYINNLCKSCETTEKFGYKTAMYATYPYLNQCLRMYIENAILETGGKYSINEQVQISCLKLTLLLINKLKKCRNLQKCENCPVKSGFHDALRLLFLARQFISTSIARNIDLKNLFPLYHSTVEQQYTILYELRSLGCSGFSKYFRKLQTDVHNTAINLNKAQYFEFSIKIFDIYLVNEVKDISNRETRGISRGLYNKSICELDCKLYEQALSDAFLSLVLSDLEPSNEKFMSLVMDIKAKMLKKSSESMVDDKSNLEEVQDTFQMLTVLDVAKTALESSPYGDLKPFLGKLKFSALLKHEFTMYAALWPSILPVAGVWRALLQLHRGRHGHWLPVSEEKEEITRTLYEVILKTPASVRTIHCDYYKEIVTELVDDLEKKSVRSLEENVILATLLLLKCEYDLTEASQRYAWKTAGHTVDPDQMEPYRTIPIEHRALRAAFKAVGIWTDLVRDSREPPPHVVPALQVAQMGVQQLLHAAALAHGLQLAGVCCELAARAHDGECFIRHAGILLSHAERDTQYTRGLAGRAAQCATDLAGRAETLDTRLTFLCELAIFYSKLEMTGVAARLVRYVQSTILEQYETAPDVNLDLSVGRLLEAQLELFGEKQCGQTILSLVNNVHKHYIALGTVGTSYTARRHRALLLRHRSSAAGVRAVRAAARLRLYRRARGAAAATLPRVAAADQALVHAYITNVSHVDEAQVKIDQRLKYILGLQPSNSQCDSLDLMPGLVKRENFSPKASNLETMLDCMTLKTPRSPLGGVCSIPEFKMPEFFHHTDGCLCYGCQTLATDVLACITCGMQASVYFRLKEFDVAREYYEGALDMFGVAEGRLKRKILALSVKNYNKSILDIVSGVYRRDLREVAIELLIDASLFELSQGNYDKSDDFIIRIHEIMSEMRVVDAYLRNEVYNAMVASANLRKAKTPDLGIEEEEELTLPINYGEAKTPESKKLQIQQSAAKIVKAEELPIVKFKALKLNLDSEPDKVEPVQPKKKSHFKVPVPLTKQSALENMTPRPSRAVPKIILTQPSLKNPSDVTKSNIKSKSDEIRSIDAGNTSSQSTNVKIQPSSKNSPEDITPRPSRSTRKPQQNSEDTPRKEEFFTPQSTSKEVFFTPMTSVKTYTKRTLVKNLEAEFATPKADRKLEEMYDVNEKGLDKTDERKGRRCRKVDLKAEVGAASSAKVTRAKRSIKRATSPGKL